MTRALTAPALRHFALLLFAISILTILTIAGCREKDTPTGPNGNPDGEWQIALENTSTLFITVDGPSILGDTIDVRLFTPEGVLAVGKALRFAAEVDVTPITAFATTVDTLSLSYGCNPALYYWGNGSDDQENPTEIIHAYYIEGSDTLAHASRSYAIAPRQ